MTKKLELAGRTFGRLIVLREAGRDRYLHIFWECQCECGNKTTLTTKGLIHGTSMISCGCSRSLVGKIFGRLTVLRKTADRDRRRCVFWECRCKCGAMVKVATSNLTRGNTKSCGCLRRERMSDVRRLKLVVGQRFGKLTVLRETPARDTRGNIFWECQCECGITFKVRASDLTRSKTKSCGCSRHEKARLRIKNLVGKTFGRLTILREAGKKNREILWECLCECGIIVEVSGHSLKGSKTKSCGCWKRDVASVNGKTKVPFSQAIEQFGKHMDSPAETIKRLREDVA